MQDSEFQNAKEQAPEGNKQGIVPRRKDAKMNDGCANERQSEIAGNQRLRIELPARTKRYRSNDKQTCTTDFDGRRFHRRLQRLELSMDLTESPVEHGAIAGNALRPYGMSKK